MKNNVILLTNSFMRAHQELFFRSIVLCFVFLLAILTGCGAQSVRPSANAVNNPNGNFHLYISNQSFAISPVDIKVFVDGDLIIKENFDVDSQHNWRAFNLKLSAGQHKIVVRSSKGSANLEQPFEVANESWAVLDYWFYPNYTRGVKPCPRHFSFEVRNEPVMFQ
ncbi:MAG TPA: hypothetical protein VGO57_00870 [Verrucomicrobiae bacterium]|jgi:hypothetical protein